MFFCCCSILACDLRGYANIRNTQQQEYQIDNTYLYSGDLQLANNFAQPILFRAAAKSSAAAPASPSSIQFAGEGQGFYFYSLKINYLLRPTSSIRLPFINSNPICQFYYRAFTSVNTGIYKGVFQRTYDFTPERFLPGGIITIRDNQILIGQSNLPDAPENFTQTITLGQDNDVRYSINGNQTASSDNNAKVTWRSYTLDITISNYKNKDVQGQLNFYGAIQTTITDSTCGPSKVDGNNINVPFKITASDNYQCQLSVTLRWG